MFKRKRVLLTHPITYTLEDLEGNPIMGGFYREELLATKYPNIYLVEKVPKTRGKKAYVKFYSFHQNHNDWIPKKEIFGHFWKR